MWTPLFLFTSRKMFHWVFEVLPLCLLAFQSLAAVTAHGNVDGWSRNAARGVKNLGKAATGHLANFIGSWSIQERTNMEEFLEQLGFSSWQRALITRAGQQTTFETTRDDELRIVTSDLRGTTHLDLPLDGAEREADDGDGGKRVCRSAKLERHAVVVTERFPGESSPVSVCRRELQPDGRMQIIVKKRTPAGRLASFRAIAARV